MPTASTRSCPGLRAGAEFTYDDGETVQQFLTSIDAGRASTASSTPRMEEGAMERPRPTTASSSTSSCADAHDVEVGDTVTVAAASGGEELDLTVQGITDDEQVLGYFTITRDTYCRACRSRSTPSCSAPIDDGADLDAGDRPTSSEIVSEMPDVEVEDREGFIGSIVDQITFIRQRFISIMLLLSIVIALIGVANTLSLSISERIRELGLLRAVGMDRPQLKRSVRWEAVIISVLGTLRRHRPGARARPGDGEGARSRPASPSSRSRSARSSCSWSAAPLVGTVAAIFPARRAAKLADPRRHRPRVAPGDTNACSCRLVRVFTEIEAHRDAVTWQPSLLALDEPDFDPALTGARRRFLGRGAWIDVVPGLGHRRRHAVRHACSTSAPWKAFERPMYDRVVDVPRLETRVVARPAAGARAHGPRASAAATASGSRRSRPTSTATGTTRWRGTATGSADVRADAVVAILSLGSDPHAPAAPRRRRPVDRVPDALRRPARAGRHLPAHLRALRPQARPRRPAHQRHVPPGRRQLTRRRSSAGHWPDESSIPDQAGGTDRTVSPLAERKYRPPIGRRRTCGIGVSGWSQDAAGRPIWGTTGSGAGAHEHIDLRLVAPCPAGGQRRDRVVPHLASRAGERLPALLRASTSTAALDQLAEARRRGVEHGHHEDVFATVALPIRAGRREGVRGRRHLVGPAAVPAQGAARRPRDGGRLTAVSRRRDASRPGPRTPASW